MTPKILQCVNGCGELVETLYEGKAIKTCPNCNSVWVSNAILKYIVETEDESWSDEEREMVLKSRGAGVPDKEIKREIPCPECSELMPAVNYQYSSGIIINKCKHNHGVWLDEGELEEIQIYMEHWKKVGQ